MAAQHRDPRHIQATYVWEDHEDFTRAKVSPSWRGAQKTQTKLGCKESTIDPPALTPAMRRMSAKALKT